eukprot:SAG11_NODE_17630_length_513_cov_0.869565_1_plen_170_part_11
MVAGSPECSISTVLQSICPDSVPGHRNCLHEDDGTDLALWSDGRGSSLDGTADKSAAGIGMWLPYGGPHEDHPVNGPITAQLNASLTQITLDGNLEDWDCVDFAAQSPFIPRGTDPNGRPTQFEEYRHGENSDTAGHRWNGRGCVWFPPVIAMVPELSPAARATVPAVRY